MKKILSVILALMLLLGIMTVAVSAADEEKSFDVITEVYDYGQRANALVVDMGKEIKSDGISITGFTVTANNKKLNGDVFYSGARQVTDVYVSAVNATGEPSTEGRYLVIELEVGSGRNATGGTQIHGSETYSGNELLDIDYSVSYTGSISYTDNTSGTVSFKQNAIRNILVDDFGRGSVTIGENTLNYRYFDPSSKYEAPAKGYPLVLFLHGGGESSTNNEIQLVANKGATLWTEPVLAAKNPCYVLAPQTSSGWEGDATVELIVKMINDFCETHNVDRNRIYVQGMSMGGIGTWNIILSHPEIFASAIVMCGMASDKWYTEENEGAWEAIKFMPIRLFVAANDFSALVDGTTKAYNKLTSLGSPVFREQWTAGSIIPAHHCWEQVYRIGTHYNWLFEQSRERTQNNTINYKTTFTQHDLSDVLPGLTLVLDHELEKVYVIEKGNQALIIDTGMSQGDICEYIVNNVLKNKDAQLSIFITHNHGDHTAGLPTFVGKQQLKTIYVHSSEAAAVRRNFGEDKITYVDEGTVIDFAGDRLMFTIVPSHTVASTVLFYNNVMFTGDAVGSGDLWLNATLQFLKRSLEHFMGVINEYKEANNYDVLRIEAGHFENKYEFYDSYVNDLYDAVCETLNGEQTPTIYTRNNALYIGKNFAHAKFSEAMLTGVTDETYYAALAAIENAQSIDPACLTEDKRAEIQSAIENVQAALTGLTIQGTVAEERLAALEGLITPRAEIISAIEPVTLGQELTLTVSADDDVIGFFVQNEDGENITIRSTDKSNGVWTLRIMIGTPGERELVLFPVTRDAGVTVGIPFNVTVNLRVDAYDVISASFSDKAVLINTPTNLNVKSGNKVTKINIVNEKGLTIGKTLVSKAKNDDGTTNWVYSVKIGTAGIKRTFYVSAPDSDKVVSASIAVVK